MKLLSAKYCLIRISIFLAFIFSLIFSLFDILKNAFSYNIYLNSIIIFAFLFGASLVYHRIFLFNNEFKRLLQKQPISKNANLISPIYIYLSNEKIIQQSKIQVILSAIEKKTEDYCSFSKYISSSLIFLGLLGTFWGLSHTIGNVANIIDNLGIDAMDAAESFSRLKESLKIPLSGMGTAFGCSLFGLSGSLILGFLNINQKKVADDFLDKIEEYLVKNAIIFDSREQDSNYHGSAFSMALLEKTIETIYVFQNQLKEFEANRNSILDIQKDFSGKLTQLIEAVSKHQEIVKVIGENQLEMQKNNMTSDAIFSNMLSKLTEIENSLNNMIKSGFMNREYIIDNLGKEIRLVSKTLSSLVRD